MIKLEQPIKPAHPRIILLRPNHARHAAVPLLARPGPAHKLALHANLRAGQHATAALAVDAEVELAAAVARAHAQHHLGVERQHERAEAQAAGADGRDEERLDERVDDGAAGAQAVGGGTGGRADEDAVGGGLGQEVAVLVNVDDGELGM